MNKQTNVSWTACITARKLAQGVTVFSGGFYDDASEPGLDAPYAKAQISMSPIDKEKVTGWHMAAMDIVEKARQYGVRSITIHVYDTDETLPAAHDVDIQSGSLKIHVTQWKRTNFGQKDSAAAEYLASETVHAMQSVMEK